MKMSPSVESAAGGFVIAGGCRLGDEQEARHRAGRRDDVVRGGTYNERRHGELVATVNVVPIVGGAPETVSTAVTFTVSPAVSGRSGW